MLFVGPIAIVFMSLVKEAQKFRALKSERYFLGVLTHQPIQNNFRIIPGELLLSENVSTFDHRKFQWPSQD